jgi:hypothetical protein
MRITVDWARVAVDSELFFIGWADVKIDWSVVKTDWSFMQTH